LKENKADKVDLELALSGLKNKYDNLEDDDFE